MLLLVNSITTGTGMHITLLAYTYTPGIHTKQPVLLTKISIYEYYPYTALYTFLGLGVYTIFVAMIVLPTHGVLSHDQLGLDTPLSQ